METGNETTECQEIENYKRGNCYDQLCLKYSKRTAMMIAKRRLICNKIKVSNKIRCIFYNIDLKEP